MGKKGTLRADSASYGQDGRASESQEYPIAAFDYRTPGWYFVTICTRGRICLLGRVADGEVLLSAAGLIVEQEWLRTADRRPYVMLDTHVVMPNHVHGLIMIRDHAHDATPVQARSPSHSLSSTVGGFKSVSSRRIAVLSPNYRCAIRQRSYSERVVRDIDELNTVRKYIANNPACWRAGI